MESVSVSLTTDASGTIVAQARYLPYGQERWTDGSAQTDFTYTGQRADIYIGLMEYLRVTPDLRSDISDTPPGQLALDTYTHSCYNNNYSGGPTRSFWPNFTRLRVNPMGSEA